LEQTQSWYVVPLCLMKNRSQFIDHFVMPWNKKTHVWLVCDRI
jgi:hypothetical protein